MSLQTTSAAEARLADGQFYIRSRNSKKNLSDILSRNRRAAVPKENDRI
jgi:hypothetical protein